MKRILPTYNLFSLVMILVFIASKVVFVAYKVTIVACKVVFVACKVTFDACKVIPVAGKVVSVACKVIPVEGKVTFHSTGKQLIAYLSTHFKNNVIYPSQFLTSDTQPKI